MMICQGADDAYASIMQKVDELLITAESHLRQYRTDNSVKKNEDDVEVNCSPAKSPNCSLKGVNARKLQSFVKHKTYRSLDKKKVLVLSSMKAREPIGDAEVFKFEKRLIDATKPDPPSTIEL
ncbi:unnamed protein product [Caenorhabditis bovis]|uniref:Uncharacterized protein n=1 Tax=Caenorhabditis bovis TaxID=2654633 RepID=A0A8S1EN53_9PELO|nr:unnamed protein product [Caenorhabditis bovis]